MRRSILVLATVLSGLIVQGGLLPSTVGAACSTDSSAADFDAGALGGCYLAETADGEVLLAPAAGGEFSGGSLPPGWTSFLWDPGGSAVVGAGVVTIDAADVYTTTDFAPGRTLETVAGFTAGNFQHVGFGGANPPYNDFPYAMFSTAAAGDQVYARIHNGITSAVDVGVGLNRSNGTCLNQTHLYRIDWTATQVDFWIDGVLVYSHTDPSRQVTANMRPAISDFPLGGVSVTVDWLRLTPYDSPCTFVSRVFDGTTTGADWTTLTPGLSTPAGTSVAIETRSGNTPTPDGTWSAFQAISGTTIQSPNGRYLQYRATLTSSDAAATPALEDAAVCHNPCTPTGPEVCDGVDNDCDGQTDEGNPGGGASCNTGGQGVCAAGLTQCQSPTLVCIPQVSPSPETCNGDDDDCDGQTDEGDPGGGGSCGTGQLGVCAAGTNHCQAGAIACVRNVAPSAETCDSLDNDCDGQTDEGDPGGGAACTTGQSGICSAGTRHCQSGALACVRNNNPVVETCNGLDDNCNGSSDEPYVDLGTSCTVGVGACTRTGVKYCRGDGTGTICSQTPGPPSADICDGLDNDCDGQTDEGNPGGGGACTTGQPGVCSPGTIACQSGGFVCVRNSAPTTEVCNNVDDDCDGTVDDGDPGGGASCSTGLPGSCNPGTRHCSGGNVVCQPNASSIPETCNNLDDDCDGQVDEGNPGGGQACSTGQLGVCSGGTRQCIGGGYSCVRTTGPSTELCAGGTDEDCDGQTDEVADCVLCLPANTVSNSAQTKRTKVRLSDVPARDQVLTLGTFVQPSPSAINPDVEPVSVRITDGAGVYYQATIPPGSFTRSGSSRRFSFSDKTLAHGGIRKAKFSIRGDAVTVKYNLKAQGLDKPAFTAGTGTATIQIGARCFTDVGDVCLVPGKSSVCQ